MFIRAKIVLTYNGDLSVTLKILFLKFDLHPRSLSEINVKDYTKKKIEKRRLKARKKAEKKALKKAKKEEKIHIFRYTDSCIYSQGDSFCFGGVIFWLSEGGGVTA